MGGWLAGWDGHFQIGSRTGSFGSKCCVCVGGLCSKAAQANGRALGSPYDSSTRYTPHAKRGPIIYINTHTLLSLSITSSVLRGYLCVGADGSTAGQSS